MMEIMSTRQWHITNRGMENAASIITPRRGVYCIDKTTLADERDGMSDWLLHMAEKDWDLTDFIVAWREACRVHKIDLRGIDVPRSIKEARRIRRG